MATINESKKYNIISFVAVATQFVQQERKGRSYYQIELQKKDGSILQAYAWENEYQGVHLIHPTEVIVHGVNRQLRGQARFQVFSLSEDFNDSSTLGQAISWPVPVDSQNKLQVENLQKLQHLVNTIQEAYLKDFLQAIFSTPEILHPFIEYPASSNHHHNQQGGLLAHSIECAEFVFNMTQGNLLPNEERELGIIAALLHDIGKIKTMTSERTHSTLGHHLPHEQLTLPILMPYLNQLESKWEQGAALLMQFLTWDKKASYFPSNPILLLIKTADQFSTGMDVRQQAFKNKPEHFYYTRFNTSSGSQYVNRLKTTNHIT